MGSDSSHGSHCNKMVTIRSATLDDWFALQHANLINLPENYTMQYYYYHFTSWPSLLQVAEDWQQNIVGYVLAKVYVYIFFCMFQ